MAATPVRYMHHHSFILGDRVTRPGIDPATESGYQVRSHKQFHDLYFYSTFLSNLGTTFCYRINPNYIFTPWHRKSVSLLDCPLLFRPNPLRYRTTISNLALRHHRNNGNQSETPQIMGNDNHVLQLRLWISSGSSNDHRIWHLRCVFLRYDSWGYLVGDCCDFITNHRRFYGAWASVQR